MLPIRGDTVLHAGDEVLVLTDPDHDPDPAGQFTCGPGVDEEH